MSKEQPVITLQVFNSHLAEHINDWNTMSDQTKSAVLSDLERILNDGMSDTIYEAVDKLHEAMTAEEENDDCEG